MTIIVRHNKPMTEEIQKHYKKVHVIGKDETVIANAYFNLGAYQGDSKQYNYKAFSMARAKINAFLDKCNDLFSIDDIVSVDGLKFQKIAMIGGGIRWEPFPNPPMPVLDKSDPENRKTHFRKYAEWINEHPHFGYPPLPMPWLHEEANVPPAPPTP